MRKLTFVALASFLFASCSHNSLVGPDYPQNAPVTKFDEYWVKDSVLTIPPKYSAVADSVFRGVHSFHTVIAPGVDRIGAGAFKDCANLTTLILPKATFIGTKAFANDSKLNSVILHNIPVVSAEAFNTAYLNVVSSKEPKEFLELKDFFYSVNGTPLGSIYDGMKGVYLVYSPGYAVTKDDKITSSENAWLKIYDWQGKELPNNYFKNLGYNSKFVKYGDYILFWSNQNTPQDWSTTYEFRLYSAKDFSLLKACKFNKNDYSEFKYAQLDGAVVLQDGSVFISINSKLYPFSMDSEVLQKDRVDVKNPLFDGHYASRFLEMKGYLIAWSYYSKVAYVYNLKSKTLKEVSTINIERIYPEGDDKFHVCKEETSADYYLKTGERAPSRKYPFCKWQVYKNTNEDLIWAGVDSKVFYMQNWFTTRLVSYNSEGEEVQNNYYDVAFHDNLVQGIFIAEDSAGDIVNYYTRKDNPRGIVKELNRGGKKLSVFFNN